ncbi:MAG: RnfABCDGE type electron transport complex subunit G [Bacteroides sp.]|nr:RnfABCDGE type electron transport complex subunit G [Bacteroidales bacterium]MBD5345293.1 RnfABCDGE type electron transport complex subunit G [Bacteroides sp.]MBD5367823.1 RnfABCDGE type electron transport complex subunit G [Bacteroides sp.]
MSGAKSTLGTMILSLGAITIIAGALLAGVAEATSEPIAEANKQKQVDAIKAVATAQFDNDPAAAAVTIAELSDDKGHNVIVFPLINGEELTGAAVESYTPNAFSGFFTIMVGFDVDGNITGYEVVKHEETAGLGAKMQDWFRDPSGHRNVIGMNPGVNNMTVSKDGGEVDAITAATISSRAFLDAIDRAYKGYNQYKASNN